MIDRLRATDSLRKVVTNCFFALRHFGQFFVETFRLFVSQLY